MLVVDMGDQVRRETVAVLEAHVGQAAMSRFRGPEN